MKKNIKSSVLVKRHGDQAYFQFADGSCEQIPRNVLARSTLLHQALWENDSDDRASVNAPEGILQSWLQWLRTSESPSIKHQPSESIPEAQKGSIEVIVGYLQVCSMCVKYETAAAILRHVASLPFTPQLHFEMTLDPLSEDDDAPRFWTWLLSVPCLVHLDCDWCIMGSLDHV